MDSIYSILAKPVRRSEFVLGKYCGLVLTLFVNVLVMTVAFYALLAYLQVRFSRADRLAAFLWAPYLGWVTFATALRAISPRPERLRRGVLHSAGHMERSPMARANKATAVAELTEHFRDSNAAVLTEYRGLTVAQLKTLRRSLGSTVTYAVVKNTLTKIAATKSCNDGTAVSGGLAQFGEAEAEEFLQLVEIGNGLRVAGKAEVGSAVIGEQGAVHAHLAADEQVRAGGLGPGHGALPRAQGVIPLRRGHGGGAGEVV